MSDDHDDSTIARQVRGVETLLEERGLVRRRAGGRLTLTPDARLLADGVIRDLLD